jgi:thioredoxin-like negative regulator of GroEL
MAKRSARKIHLLPVLAIVLLALVAYVAWRARREGFANGNTYTVVYVYSTTCTYCKQFEPVWSKFQEQINAAKLQNVKLEKSADAAKYNIKAFPTVLLLENTKTKAMFTGERTPEELWNFLRTNMKPT